MARAALPPRNVTIRIHNSGVHVLAPPMTNLLGWYKADAGVFSDAGTTLATNTQTVQQWNNQATTSANLTQATAGLRPQFLTAGQNNLPCVKVSGTGKYISGLMNGSDDASFFCVIRQDVWTGDKTQVAFDIAGNIICNGSVGGTQGTPNLIAQARGGNNPVLGPAIGAWAIICFEFGKSNGIFRINAGSSTFITGDAETGNFGGANSLYAGYVSGTQGWSFGEILLYNTILSTADETAARNYLNARWAIF